MKPQKRTRNGRTRWVARYVDPAGRERSRTFDTRHQAADFIAEREREVKRGTWLDPADALTVAEVYDMWTARPVRQSSLTAYTTTRRQLGPLADYPARSLTRAAVDSWFRQLTTGRPWAGGKPLAERTARAHLSRLSSALSMAVDEQLIGRNPVRMPGRGPRRAVLQSEIPTDDQLDALIRQIETGGHPLRHGAGSARPWPDLADMVRTVRGSGLRRGEVCGLDASAVDFMRRVVHVSGSYSGRGGPAAGVGQVKTPAGARAVPVADDLLAVLGPRCGDGGPVFRGHRGGRINPGFAGDHLGWAADAAGCPGVTFHRIRHYYASRLIAAGVPVTGVQAALGHESAALTLSVYAHFWPGAEDVTRAAIAGTVSGTGTAPGPGAAGEPGLVV